MLAPRLGVIADDLTGSCDAGVKFAQRGFSSAVRLHPAQASPTELVILCTHSRNDPPDVARGKVRQACELLIGECREVVYKKIDSTLQGNIWPELEEAMKCCGCSLAIVAPAFPALGRTIEGGWLHVAGTPGLPPVHVPTLLQRQGAPNVIHVGATLLRSDPRELIERLERASATPTCTIAVIDAVSEHDLALIIRAVAELPSRCLMAGSAGLAGELADSLAKEHGRRTSTKYPVSGASCGHVVLVLGSTHPVTAAQVRYLVATRPTTVVEYPGRPLEKGQGHLIVKLARDDNGPDPGALATILGDSTSHGVILSGGDTADRVCRALKVNGIRLDQEIAPGIPLGRFEGGCVDGMAVVTKAGGFGGEDALAVAVDLLSAQERPAR
jgi:D-threonate/D-erythronate kinase